MKKIKLTEQNIEELKKLFEFPRKYKEFRHQLLEYLDKTCYSSLSSLENAVLVNQIIRHIKIKSLVEQEEIGLYFSKDTKEYSPYQISQALFSGGYFCNFTSLFYHELTNQVPSKVYIAVESDRKKDHSKNIALDDYSIQRAFLKPHRESGKKYKFESHELILTEKVFRNKTGVENIGEKSDYWGKNYQITCLEKALIDAVVNPQYNGGISNTKEYYKNGSSRVNVDKFMEIYKNLGFIYPYWQAIGLISEKVGMSKLSDTLHKAFKVKNKFYIDHEAKLDWKFDEKWQTFYPEYLF